MQPRQLAWVTFVYSCINESFIKRATSLLGPWIVGPNGGTINEVSLYIDTYTYRKFNTSKLVAEHLNYGRAVLARHMHTRLIL